MRIEPRIGLFERLKHLLGAIGKHKELLIGAVLFSLFGIFPIYFSMNAESGVDWSGVLLGSIFLVPTTIMLYMVATSTAYYYEKSLSKKYGVNLLGRVTHKRAEDHSYTEGDSDREIEEIHYIIEFSYRYSGMHESEFYVDSQECYARIKIGDEVPIRVLRFKPKAVYPRVRKLAAAYGLKQSQCA
ncbi:MAG: hypothetical protein P8103_09050 [Candidatus Thiodiazotropha sp.]